MPYLKRQDETRCTVGSQWVTLQNLPEKPRNPKRSQFTLHRCRVIGIGGHLASAALLEYRRGEAKSSCEPGHKAGDLLLFGRLREVRNRRPRAQEECSRLRCRCLREGVSGHAGDAKRTQERLSSMKIGPFGEVRL